MQPDHHFFNGNGMNTNMMSSYNGLFQSNFNFQSSNQSFCSNSSFYPLEVSDLTNTTSTTPEARALVAMNNHKEAEKRRRERINSHLDRLRTLLPCTSKTDKASLLAKVVERVRELKHETSEIMQLETSFPSETDEIQVLVEADHNLNYSTNNHGKILMKASLCCEDRSNLIPELIDTLKSLHLSPLRAEMVSLCGRIRNVIVLAGDKDHYSTLTDDQSLAILSDALKSLVQQNSSYEEGERSKRRKVFNQS